MKIKTKERVDVTLKLTGDEFDLIYAALDSLTPNQLKDWGHDWSMLAKMIHTIENQYWK